jgi:hypothetical protein
MVSSARYELLTFRTNEDTILVNPTHPLLLSWHPMPGFIGARASGFIPLVRIQVQYQVRSSRVLGSSEMKTRGCCVLLLSQKQAQAKKLEEPFRTAKLTMLRTHEIHIYTFTSTP